MMIFRPALRVIMLTMRASFRLIQTLENIKDKGDSQQLCWCHFKVLLIYSSEHHLRYASNSFDRLCTRMRITYPLDYLHIGKQ